MELIRAIEAYVPWNDQEALFLLVFTKEKKMRQRHSLRI